MRLVARHTAESREPGAWIDHAGDGLPEGQLTLAGRTQGRFEAQRSGQIVDGPDGADG